MSTWQPVDRRLVHKAAIAEVLVTDLTVLGSELYAVGAQWPRSHTYFRPDGQRRPHPLLFVETLRQAGLHLSHRRLGVPLGHHFVFESISAEYTGASPPATGGPETVVLAVAVHADRRGTRTLGAELEIEGWLGETHLATAHVTYRCLSPAAYARIRSPALVSSHGEVGARRDAEPAGWPEPPGPGDRRFPLRIDYGNLVFFDHPVDHIPGMLLLDAAIQSAGLTDPRRWDGMRSLGMCFRRFAELGVPTWVTAHSHREGSVERTAVSVQQWGRDVAEGWVESS